MKGKTPVVTLLVLIFITLVMIWADRRVEPYQLKDQVFYSISVDGARDFSAWYATTNNMLIVRAIAYGPNK